MPIFTNQFLLSNLQVSMKNWQINLTFLRVPYALGGSFVVGKSDDNDSHFHQPIIFLRDT